MKRRRTPKSSEQSAAAEHPKSFRMLKVTRILSQVRHPEFGGGGAPDPRLGLALQFVCAMILPQVHLRKPCYDFSFL